MGDTVVGQPTEIETLAAFDTARRASPILRGWFVQSLDLTGRDPALLSSAPQGAVFLGCRLSEVADEYLRRHGALIFPRQPDVPFDPYRGALYSPAELYASLLAGGHYGDSLDAVVYAWARSRSSPPGVGDTLAMSLHDHAVSDALDELLERTDPAMTVGIMGGHALERGTPGYLDAALLGRALARAGRTVLTGGGPGAMEGANLGAALVGHGDAALDSALVRLAAAPTFREPTGIDAWARAGFDVLADLGSPAPSVGIPTWFYGHEPPNVFATSIAKYFSNAVREDTLLVRCKGGIVYLPGRAGTVQELFEAATGGYYTLDPALVAPLVLVGVDFWTRQLPAWPLLQALAANRPLAERIHLVETVAEAGAVLGG